MLWVRAVWKEEGREEEGTVPNSWIRDGTVYWPNVTNVLRAMTSGKVPNASWQMFPLIKEKLRSESRAECESYDFTSAVETEDEKEETNQPRERKKRVFSDFYTGDESMHKDTELEPNSKKPASSKNISTLQTLPKPPSKHRSEAPNPITSPSHVTSPRRSVTLSPQMSPSSRRVMLPSPRRILTTPARTSVRPFTPRCLASVSRSVTPPPSRIHELTPALGSGANRMEQRRRSPTGWSDRLGYSSPVRASSPAPLPSLASPRRSPRRHCATRLTEQSSSSHLPEGTSCSAYPMSTAKFQKKVLTMLADIRLELREQREGKEMAISDLQTIPFQARSIDELQRIDGTLKTPEDCLKMTMALACVGGSSINENARKILQKLMTNETMSAYSIKGKKGKLRFQNLKLFKVVLDAVVRTMQCTETSAETAMSVALKYAPDRRGGGGRKKADGDLLLS